MKKKLLLVFLGLVVLGAGGYYAWTLLSADPAAETGPVFTVRRGNLVDLASASGTIEPHVMVEVKSRTSGEVIEVLVREGQQVEAGQLLFRLDPADAERAVREARTAERRARAEISQANASLGVARTEAENSEASSAVAARGAELGLVSAEARRTAAHQSKVAQANIGLRRAQLNATRTSLETARLNVENAERRLAETRIYAPIAGTVLSVNAERGSIVASGITSVSGGTALATIADLNDLRIIGAIDEALISRVRVGQDVAIRVDAYPDRAFTGRVERVSPLGETVSNVVTFDVEIVVTDAQRDLLRSGMSADVEIETARHQNVLLVPVMAVQSTGPRRSVRLESGERRVIRTGSTDGTSIVVLSGLAEGDRLVMSRPRTANGAQNQTKSLFPMGGRPPGGASGGGGGRPRGGGM